MKCLLKNYRTAKQKGYSSEFLQIPYSVNIYISLYVCVYIYHYFIHVEIRL